MAVGVAGGILWEAHEVTEGDEILRQGSNRRGLCFVGGKIVGEHNDVMIAGICCERWW